MSRMDLRIDPTRDERRDGCGGMAAEGSCREKKKRGVDRWSASILHSCRDGGGGGSADGISRRFARPARLGLACVTARVHEVTEVTDGESRGGQRRGTSGPELGRCGWVRKISSGGFGWLPNPRCAFPTRSSDAESITIFMVSAGNEAAKLRLQNWLACCVLRAMSAKVHPNAVATAVGCAEERASLWSLWPGLPCTSVISPSTRA